MKSLYFYQKINAYLNSDNYPDVILCLERHLDNNPNDLNSYWYLALVYLLQGDWPSFQEIWIWSILTKDAEKIEELTANLFDFLEIKLEENIVAKKLGNAKIIYESLLELNPDYQNHQLKTKLIESLFYFADILVEQDDRYAATDVYLEILNLDPEHELTWQALTNNYYALEDYSKAEQTIRKCIEINGELVDNYQMLGSILDKLDKKSESQSSYQKAIKILYHNLNNNSKNQRVENFIALGNIYQNLENQEEAALCFGNAFYENHDYQNAIRHYEEFLDFCNLNSDVYVFLTRSYVLTNQTAQAINCAQKGLSLFPASLKLKRIDQTILPIIYKSISEIYFYRDRFKKRLKELIENTSLSSPEEQRSALESIDLVTNFYIGYQGFNDVNLNKIYASYSHSVISSIYPNLCQLSKQKISLENRKIRVGYLSSRLHTLGRIYLNWLKHLNRDQFEIYVYDVSGHKESSNAPFIEFRDNFKVYSDFFKIIPSPIQEISQLIRSDSLDILIFLDIGLEPKINQISCLQLAPIQCTTWGHPITSGSPTIDYFLSSKFMEPDDAQNHYSEQLVCLPKLGFSIPCPEIPSATINPSEFQIRDGATVYLCTQSLLKYQPQYDYLLPLIAQQNPSSQFIFFHCFLGPVITDDFIARLAKVFAEFGLDFERYCTFLDQCERQKFLQLNLMSHIFLDTFRFSGGLTTLDAIACGLPVVTCPGELMRSRQSYGMLKILGVTETIAKNETEYVEIAVRLGLDSQWRQNIHQKMMKNRYLLFDDTECIEGLENFFYQSIKKYNQDLALQNIKQ